EVGGLGRVGGGRSAQALGAGEGALELRWQRPQERPGRCRSDCACRLAQRAVGDGRSRGRLGGHAPALREARGSGGRAYTSAQPPPRAPAGPPPRRGDREALGREGRASCAAYGPRAAPRTASV
ncbi:MAG: hypothetical protein AVDCRST_MAG58-3645, partial [uncultured Rubrobacteraceae bacterium]